MKKFLSMFGAMGMVATSSATVIACEDKRIDLSKITIRGTDLSYKYEGDAPGTPTAENILDAFNDRNDVNLKLETDVIIENVELTYVQYEPVYLATIRGVKGSKLVIQWTAIDVTFKFYHASND